MSISQKRYVNITSAVSGSEAAPARELILRLFTTSELAPYGEPVEFTSADSVGAWFGTTSEEYERSVQYFGWVSPLATKAQKISFQRWAEIAIAPTIHGKKAARSLANFTPISDGAFSLTLGGTTHAIDGLDFTAATSLANVAAIIQTEVRTNTGALWTGATVTYDATAARFILTGGATGSASIAVAAGTTGTDIGALIGFTDAEAIVSEGADMQDVAALLAQSIEVSNNFASFAFMPALTSDQKLAVAEWNDAQNNDYIYCLPVTAAGASADYAALGAISGTAATLDPQIDGEYPELAPATILASTDYSAINASPNYMYKDLGLTAAVVTDSGADTYDAMRINYTGQTQRAGKVIKFYQRGKMWGGDSDAVDINTYANELWLKDSAQSALLSLLVASNKLPANATGKGTVLGVLQGVIDKALTNGTISREKALTENQKAQVTQITGDNSAWRKVQSLGYWVDAVVESYSNGGSTEYKVTYTLIYSKDDQIRKINGRDILI